MDGRNNWTNVLKTCNFSSNPASCPTQDGGRALGTTRAPWVHIWWTYRRPYVSSTLQSSVKSRSLAPCPPLSIWHLLLHLQHDRFSRSHTGLVNQLTELEWKQVILNPEGLLQTKELYYCNYFQKMYISAYWPAGKVITKPVSTTVPAERSIITCHVNNFSFVNTCSVPNSFIFVLFIPRMFF